MAAKPKSVSLGDAGSEYGATGLRQYSGYVREEWLRDLIGRKGMLKLREMADSDPIIAAVLFAVQMLLRGVPIRVEPAGKDPDDETAADFVQSCFADMEMPFADFMADCLSFLQFGFGVYEMVFKFRRGPDEEDPRYKSNYTDGKVGWRKFAGRAQETLLHWVFNEAGDATAMIQLLPTGGPLLTVPLEKCLHFRTTPYKANPEGRSILRSVYKYYFLKQNIQQIEAIGVSRDLTGLLHVQVPAAWTQKDAPEEMKAALAAAQQMATMIAQNEQAALVTPMIVDKNNNELFKVSLLATGGRRQFATPEIINRYDHGIAAAFLADFITLGTGTSRGSGSNAQSKNKSDMFATAVVAFLDIICQQLERKAVPMLLKLNRMKGQVRVTHGDIARRDLEELGQYILDLAQAGLIVPDASLEAHVREEGGLPAADDIPGDPTATPVGSTTGAPNDGGAATGATMDQPDGGNKTPPKKPGAAQARTVDARNQAGGKDPNNPNAPPPAPNANANAGANAMPGIYGSKNPLLQRATALAMAGSGTVPTAANPQAQGGPPYASGRAANPPKKPAAKKRRIA